MNASIGLVAMTVEDGCCLGAGLTNARQSRKPAAKQAAARKNDLVSSFIEVIW